MISSRSLFAVSILVASLVLVGCGSITRVERDIHTIVEVDTLVTKRVQNLPGERDNGIIFPSPTTESRDRDVRRYDSLAVREYPAFIRLGLFEGIGLIGSSIDGESTKRSMFGLYYDINDLLFGRETDSTSHLFDGYIHRIGIMEWKLPLFDNAQDWTWGVTAYERLQADAENSLTGMGVLTVSKRIYYSKRIPYMALRPSVSLAAFPSMYVNTSVSGDVGSIGGLNLRAYVGYAFGGEFGRSRQSSTSTFESVNFPYFGIGVSALDFLNREEETETEWKYHEHSAWEIGAIDLTLLGSSAERSFMSPADPPEAAPTIKGLTVRLATADIALPFLNYKVSVGTSLFEALILGPSEYGISMLPIRVTYHWLPFKRDLRIDPFIEYGYAPSSFGHVGVRTTLPLSDQMNLQIVTGYVQGNTGSSIPGLEDQGYSFIKDRYNRITAADPNFSTVYLGIGVGLYTRQFNRGDLRYGKGYPHE